MMIKTLVLAALLSAFTAEASTIERRFFGGKEGGVCFLSCGANGQRGQGWFNRFKCICDAEYTGACCRKRKPCEIPPLETVPIDIAKFTEKSWFIQKQQTNGYQSANDLYCVVATYDYNPDRKKNWITEFLLPNKKGSIIDVNNYANKGEVNGAVMGGKLCGRISDVPGKLSVAPCFLPNIAAGPYWVIALDEENYEWAVIIGGQPKEFGTDDTKCTTAKKGINNTGLWLFTRAQIADPQVVANMERILNELGISTNDLLPVAQEGCEYNGSALKV